MWLYKRQLMGRSQKIRAEFLQRMVSLSVEHCRTVKLFNLALGKSADTLFFHWEVLGTSLFMRSSSIQACNSFISERMRRRAAQRKVRWEAKVCENCSTTDLKGKRGEEGRMKTGVPSTLSAPSKRIQLIAQQNMWSAS